MSPCQCRVPCRPLRCRLEALCIAIVFLTLFLCMLHGSDAARKQFSRYAGPHRLKFEEFYLCNQSDESNQTKPIDAFIFYDNRNTSESECPRLIGNVTIHRDFAVNAQLPTSVILNQWRDKEWKRDGITMKFPNGFKAFNDHVPAIYRLIFGDTNHIRKGFYPVDVPLNVTIKAIPIFPYGRWKGKIQMSIPEEQKGGTRRTRTPAIVCINFLINIVPK